MEVVIVKTATRDHYFDNVSDANLVFSALKEHGVECEMFKFSHFRVCSIVSSYINQCKNENISFPFGVCC